MVELELPIKEEEVVWDAGAPPPEVEHWFYSLPCAGVRYYTFEHRPLSRYQMKPHTQQRQEPAGRQKRLERGGGTG